MLYSRDMASSPSKPLIAVVGLGYVGLPLAHAFASRGHNLVGFDIDVQRIDELKNGTDRTKELSSDQLRAVTIDYTTDPSALKRCDIVILAIPTPVDERNKPDLSLVESATRTVGKNLKKGAIVVYESTVYPGVTQEFCGPILEKESGMTCGKDFTLGYSPERINPGDKEHTVHRIVKIVAGQDAATTERLVALYGSIVDAGIHRAPSIKVAEMAKAIENAQRDINIAYVNEIAMLCDALGIPTKDVLDAAGTKWNFLKFQPGLVGGHCIGVDPYYLVEIAQQLGIDTALISASRAINDGMATYIAGRVMNALPENPSVLVLGLTFKENIPDMRNSKVQDVIKVLEDRGARVVAHDPYVKPGAIEDASYDAVLLLVPHREYLAMGSEKIAGMAKRGGVVFDLKSVLERKAIEGLGMAYRAL
jgi:UDP-N-acetyl-D-galactosamine dehydrogenase